MDLIAKTGSASRIFIDTAPVIYYIEADPKFGDCIKKAIDSFQQGNVKIVTSVITLLEVLPKPIEKGREDLAEKFAEFIKHGKNVLLIHIDPDIAEKAGKLKGQYTFLKSMDAIQIGTALETGCELFITNDTELTKIKEIEIIVLKDYI